MNLVPRPTVMSYGPNQLNFPGLDRIFRQIQGENPVSSRADVGMHVYKAAKAVSNNSFAQAMPLGLAVDGKQLMSCFFSCVPRN